MYQQLVSYLKFNPDITVRIDDKGFEDTDIFVNKLNKEMKVNQWYICETGGLPVGKPYWITVFKTKDGILFYYNDYIVFKSTSTKALSFTCVKPDEYMWCQVFQLIGFKSLCLNQYDYCEAILNTFWKKVFGKTAADMWCGGIVTSHGDKAYSYKRKWEKQGIPFERGVLLFLLTYTSEMDREKPFSDQFVIDKYKYYLPKIEEAEKEVFFL